MMNSKRPFLILALISALAFVSLLLVGCAEEPKPEAEPAEQVETPAEQPAEAPPAEPEAKEEPAAEPEAKKPEPKAAAAKKSLQNPSALNEKAPENYQVKFETSKGDILIDVTRSWAPHGADRFYNLVKNGFYDDCRFFRVVTNFIVQFGMHGDARTSQIWANAQIKDDPVTKTNRKGAVVFATAGPNTRTTQVFINLKANAFLDNQGFAPFGQISSEGMKIVESLYSGYGERPEQPMIRTQGNNYLKSKFPELDYIKKATIVE